MKGRFSAHGEFYINVTYQTLVCLQAVGTCIIEEREEELCRFVNEVESAAQAEGAVLWFLARRTLQILKIVIGTFENQASGF